jgi:antitoxin CcdA
LSRAYKKPTNLSIDDSLLREARALNINLSRAAENGVKAAVREAKTNRWKSENADAIESSNVYVDQNGLPLEDFRRF